MEGSASRMTLPPSPPSPPSGPPRGTNFSRRKLTHPAPPSPPLTKTSISSTNTGSPRSAARAGSGGLLGDAHELVIALALEAHVTILRREQGVVDAQSHVDPRLEARAALANEDAPGGDELTPEALHPQHLGVGIPAVSRAADALLVCHRPRPRSR